MANNAQKIAFQTAMNRFAEKKVLSAIQLLGKSLTASIVSVDGSIVTVKFELESMPFTLPNVTIPMIGPEYIRYPMQVGDKGVVVSADVRLGGISGLGSGNASLISPANLTALYFVPIGNKNWDAPIDSNKLELYGPDGVVIKTKAAVMPQLTITESTVAVIGTLTVNGTPVTMP